MEINFFALWSFTYLEHKNSHPYLYNFFRSFTNLLCLRTFSTFQDAKSLVFSNIIHTVPIVYDITSGLHSIFFWYTKLSWIDWASKKWVNLNSLPTMSQLHPWYYFYTYYWDVERLQCHLINYSTYFPLYYYCPLLTLIWVPY